MPLFFTPKPRQFHYDPRFYDPEKEKWEELKKKYSTAKEDSKSANNQQESTQQEQNIGDGSQSTQQQTSSDDDLRYFEEKVRRIDREKDRQPFSWRDLFRKREMPKFNYQPRFQNGTESSDTSHTTEPTAERSYKVRIRRRYDIEDPDYMKPVSAGKIMLYALLACLLLYWILF